MGKFAENLNLGKRVLPPSPGKLINSYCALTFLLLFKTQHTKKLKFWLHYTLFLMLILHIVTTITNYVS